MTLFAKIRMNMWEYKRQEEGAVVKAYDEKFDWEHVGKVLRKDLFRYLTKKPWLLVITAVYHDGAGWLERPARWRHRYELLEMPPDQSLLDVLNEHQKFRTIKSATITACAAGK